MGRVLACVGLAMLTSGCIAVSSSKHQRIEQERAVVSHKDEVYMVDLRTGESWVIDVSQALTADEKVFSQEKDD